MFWAEDLLTKNGPLARVWLASNLERKLSKQNVLSEKIETKVQDIIVRIYSRKARYLLDDCNEALVKIKLAFRPGNVDLPTGQSHTAARDALILPDTITDLDLFAPLLDPEELLREPESTRGPGRDPTLLVDFGTSQLLPESQTPSRREQRRTLLDDLDLDLDLGLEPGEEVLRSTPGEEDRSIEIGRRAHTPKPDQPSMLLEDDDLGLDYGLDVGDTTIGGATSTHPVPADDDMPMLGGDDDVPMAGMDDDIAERNAAALARASAAAEERRQRDSASPLSSIRSSIERDLEQTFQLSQAQIQEEEDPTILQATQRVKRRKVIRQDPETELHNTQIRKQQEDRSGITKAPSFLPRDPLLLQLMEMQRNGGFVSSIMGDGRMQGWAPELRGILSLEIVRKAGEKKRKRDSGVADVETASERQETPQLDLPIDLDEGFPTDLGAGGDFGADPTLQSEAAAPLPMSDQPVPADDFDEEGAFNPAFDTTEAPLLHPAQTGPVSLGTKNAVHLLRAHFAPTHPLTATEPPTPSKRVTSEAKFTDLCPEATTSRQDATKMFFELLVLGTKDAVKVEQDRGDLGAGIRVRGKRGLWGDWAERGAGGEIATREEEQQVEV